MYPCYNVADKVIKKLLKFEGVYHAVVHDYQGKIHHGRFSSETEAREFMEQFSSAKVIVDYAD